MDKLLDKLQQIIEREQIQGRKAMGNLEAEAGKDGHGPREKGKFVKAAKSKPTKGDR